ncbi:hypothetical protein D9M69_604000 [compost metagenome]
MRQVIPIELARAQLPRELSQRLATGTDDLKHTATNRDHPNPGMLAAWLLWYRLELETELTIQPHRWWLREVS